MDHNKAIYLRLSPEFGEHRFGPYENLEVRVGSDRQNCAICIENFGALPIHCKLLIQGEKDLILVPSERSAEVFLWRKNKIPEQIFGATAVVPGDAFSIIMQNGPKFIIEWDELPEEIKVAREKAASRSGVGRNRLSKKSMGDEVKRQAFTQLLVMGPMQLLQRAVIFVKSGAIYQPRNIIAGAVLLSGWIIGGSMSCRASKQAGVAQAATERFDDCDKKLQKHEGATAGEIGVSDAVFYISNSDNLRLLLEEDDDLFERVKKKSKSLFRQDLSWLFDPKRSAHASEVGSWIKSVQSFKDSFDPDTARLLMWNVSEKDRKSTDFYIDQNPNGGMQCGRGILQFSYQQATHLGLKVQPDVFHEGNSAKLTSKEKQDLLKTTMLHTLDIDEDSDDAKAVLESLGGKELTLKWPKGKNVKETCLYISDVDDDRDDATKVLSGIQEIIGLNKKELPRTSNQVSPGARIATLYIAGIDRKDFRDSFPLSKFDDYSLSESLDGLEGGDLVLEQTAEAIARSLVYPCRLVLEGNEKAQAHFVKEPETDLPKPLHCFAYQWDVLKKK